MVMTWSGSPPPDGETMLDHVVTVVLKQLKDGLLVKALDQGDMQDIMGVFALSQQERYALTFPLNDGTEKPLAIGHKNLLRALKIFANYHKADGSPIDDWTAVTKKDFDDFKCSRACRHATERDDTIAPSTMSVTTSKGSPSTGEDQGDLGLTDGEAALHHVLSEVFYPGWRETISEALERNGFKRFKMSFS